MGWCVAPSGHGESAARQPSRSSIKPSRGRATSGGAESVRQRGRPRRAAGSDVSTEAKVDEVETEHAAADQDRGPQDGSSRHPYHEPAPWRPEHETDGCTHRRGEDERRSQPPAHDPVPDPDPVEAPATGEDGSAAPPDERGTQRVAGVGHDRHAQQRSGNRCQPEHRRWHAEREAGGHREPDLDGGEAKDGQDGQSGSRGMARQCPHGCRGGRSRGARGGYPVRE